jgi:hypothetical protein
MATVCNQEEADRDLPKLIAMKLRHAARWIGVSYEPALGPIDTEKWQRPGGYLRWMDWVIAGGESGPKARPAHPHWFVDIRDVCADAGVPFLFKQWGEWAPVVEGGHTVTEGRGRTGAILRSHGWEIFDRGRQHGDVFRIGKKQAGRLLDGREHNGFPRVYGDGC